MDWIEAKPFVICREGEWHAETGVFNISAEELKTIVAVWAEDVNTLAEADLPAFRIGHPGFLDASEPPRIGRILDLWADGPNLWCKAEFHPDWVERLRSGEYPGRSCGLIYNDTTKRWRLHHVAILGASPPAVEGMDPIEFRKGGKHVFASQLTTAQASDYSFAEVGKSKEKESMSKLKKIARYLGMTPREVLVQLAEGDQAQSDPPEATTRKDDFETVWTELARLSTGLEKCVAMCEELAQKMEAYEIANDMKDGDSGDANASAAKPDAQASANDPSPQLAAERAMLVTLKQLTQEAASSIETSLAAIPVNLRAETQAKLIAMAQSAGEMSLLSSTLYRPTQDKRDRKQIFFDHLRRDPRDEKELDRFFQHNKHLSVQ